MSASSHASPRPRLQQLAGLVLFEGLGEGTLRRLVEKLPTDTRQSGEWVVREGDEAESMYVVLGGELEVLKQVKDRSETRVALLGPGDWFGESGLLQVGQRLASVRSLAPTLLLRIEPESVERLLAEHDPKDYGRFMRNVARALCQRLRTTNGVLSQVLTTLHQSYSVGNQLASG